MSAARDETMPDGTTGGTPGVLLAHHLKQLKLPTVLREYDKVAREAARDGVDHPRYLLRLVELELIDRERRLVERRIRQARFPISKTRPRPIPTISRRARSSRPDPPDRRQTMKGPDRAPSSFKLPTARAFSVWAESVVRGSQGGGRLIQCSLRTRSERWADPTAWTCASGWWTPLPQLRVIGRQPASGSGSPRRSAGRQRSRLPARWRRVPARSDRGEDRHHPGGDARPLAGRARSEGRGGHAVELPRRARPHVQKKTAHAAEQDRPDVKTAREAWFEGQPDLDPARLVFLDETWTATNMARTRGRCPRGERLRSPVPQGHWKTTTLVAALRSTATPSRPTSTGCWCRNSPPATSS